MTRSKLIRVAIDGPAGVGKTTTARALARELGLLYVDTGAMYRALAVHAAVAGVSLDDGEAAAGLARSTKVTLRPSRDGLKVRVNNVDVTEAIRTEAASDGASRISFHGAVRCELVAWQRALAEREGVVMEGRDIGTVVLPDAEAKVFLTASPEERARRRHQEMLGRGVDRPLDSVLRDILERDGRDQGRAESPLRPAPDAVVIDCTALDAMGQVAAVRRVVEAVIRIHEGVYE